MKKQEEIREGIYQIIDMVIDDFIKTNDGTDTYVDKVLNKLHSQGVVLKVERELPYISLEQATEHDTSEPWCAGNFTDSLQAFGKKAQQDMLKAGYVAVEPLIEEK